MLDVKLISDQAEWENYLKTFPEANFLQSWHWGQFHRRLGKTILPQVFFNEQKHIVGLAMGVIETAKRGRYLTLAGGPLTDWGNLDLLNSIFTQLKQEANKHRCDFIRLRPQALDNPSLRTTMKALGWALSPMHLTADLTLQLDLTQPEEQLLARMRKSTRYEVKKSQKMGIETRLSTNLQEIEVFYQHQLELAKKHQFVAFSYTFLREQFSAFLEGNHVLLIHSYLENKLLASAFVIFYNQEAVYHYGISTVENQRFPGAYAVQWAAIQEAKRRGCSRYNFWGIAPEAEEQHRFAGVSTFKRGFGGQEVAYLPAHDLPLTFRYHFIFGFELLRKKIRRL